MILASNSPRRKQLLAEAGYQFVVKSFAVDENYSSDLEVQAIAEHLAVKKNDFYRERFLDEVIISADTTVIFQNELLEKPADADQAKQMLENLSGNGHEVISGVCISDLSIKRSFSVRTEVQFKSLSELEIDYYITKYQPFDKAGAYGIQEWIGMVGIKKIVGSYT